MIVPYDPPLTERESGFQIALSQERIDHCITKRKIAALEAENERMEVAIRLVLPHLVPTHRVFKRLTAALEEGGDG